PRGAGSRAVTRRRLLVAVGIALLVALGLAVHALTSRPGMQAYRAHAAPALTPAPGQLTATWYGVSALLLDDGQHAVFVDPFFTRPTGFANLVTNRPIAPDDAVIHRWLTRAGVRRLDAVLVSHSHFDHAMDAGVVARQTGAQLLGSASTASIGRGAGLPGSQITVIRPGQALQFGTFRITFFQSRHAGATGGRPTGDITEPLVPPARFMDYRQGGTWSILVEHPEGRLLHHGSAGFAPGVLKNVRADVVFLGVALIDDLARYLREVVDPLGATRVIPVHWDDFTRSLDEPLLPMPVIVRLDRFFEDMARLRPSVAVQTLEMGRRYPIFPSAPDVPTQ
ncbi:MAG TPA: MBL fold metallo-hydrolase, partial [Nevskiaceae bacterium]|nr:MBL fold metallo-hydrolase [Nevskiaceae bacterium]